MDGRLGLGKASRKLAEAKPIAFDSADNAQTCANCIDGSAALWERLSDIAQRNQAAPTKILDLGGGPGEPGCHFAAKYSGTPTIASDKAPAMVEQARLRVSAKGLKNVECIVLDMQDLRAIGDGSVDLVVSSQSYQFCPDKPLALRETCRVMKSGGVAARKRLGAARYDDNMQWTYARGDRPGTGCRYRS